MRLGRVEDRTRYVVGFAFNESRKKVALIDKKREPLNSDMAGTFNGIGGAALARESYHAAMIREFKQETGALVTSWDALRDRRGRRLASLLLYRGL